MGNIADVRAILPLKSMLKDKNEEVRKAADSAFGQISEIEASEALLRKERLVAIKS